MSKSFQRGPFYLKFQVFCFVERIVDYSIIGEVFINNLFIKHKLIEVLSYM